jgi:hypothetical protein
MCNRNIIISKKYSLQKINNMKKKKVSCCLRNSKECSLARAINLKEFTARNNISNNIGQERMRFGKRKEECLRLTQKKTKR